MNKILIGFCGLALAAPAFSSGQDPGGPLGTKPVKIVNMDSGYVLAEGEIYYRISGAVFGGDENNEYGSFEFGNGVGNGGTILIRGSFADVQSHVGTTGGGGGGGTNTIRYGGSDLELLYRRPFKGLEGLAGAIGISFPNTPAQDDPHATTHLTWSSPQDWGALVLGARGVHGDDSTIIGVGAGAIAVVGPGWEAAADFTLIVEGNNTIDTESYEREAVPVWGVLFRYTNPGSANQMAYEIGFGNGLGPTTGFSLSPALGDSIGVYFGISGRVRS